jgi:hypothetical protein
MRQLDQRWRNEFSETKIPPHKILARTRGDHLFVEPIAAGNTFFNLVVVDKQTFRAFHKNLQ